MKNGKYAKHRGVASKTLALVVVMMLVIGCTIGGTIAWLTAKTDPVVNTFTVGDINISLTETWNTDTNGDGTNDAWQAKLIPGSSYQKDPKVTVEAGSEKCYLFIKFEEENNPATYLTYTSNLKQPDWTQGDGTNIPANVWYRVVEANATDDQSWYLLTGNSTYTNGCVTVKDTVTKDVMPAALDAPKLTYTAYACQFENLTPQQAWEKVQPTT